MKPTRTMNRIHFEDLETKRFEDLCLNIIYREKAWAEINHYGASGSDDGVDIYAKEETEGSFKSWAIQCKRYKKISKTELKSIIDKILQNTMPDTILTIVACDVSKTMQTYYEKYAMENGISNSILWTQSILEAKLYNNYKDLLYVYFNIDINRKVNSKVTKINRNIKFREIFKKELYVPFDPKKPLIGPHRFNCRKIIIQKYDHNVDEENTKDTFGWYPYFSGEPYQITDDGLQLVIGLRSGYVKDNQFIEKDSNMKVPEGIEINTFLKMALLPYENILTYDFNSGEGRPIMYCNYNGETGPFAEVYFTPYDE